jgi:chaperone required for assembly of F1-ATPase
MSAQTSARCPPPFRLVAAHNDGILMRDIFTEIYQNRPLDPTESARQGARPALRRRFFERAHIGDIAGEGVPILLDGKPVKTPARNALAAPTPALAEHLAQEWNAQQQVIDPGRMPLTRLANAVIDTVAEQSQPVSEEIAKYLGSDLLFYRADAPPGLVARQTQHWDPVMTWAHQTFGARFMRVEGVVFVAQPDEAIAAARAAIPADTSNVKDIWRLGAVASITTLTGSALLALALAHGKIGTDAAWAAAHVDEDWQMEHWGHDDVALTRRAYRFAEMQAAVTVLRHAR